MERVSDPPPATAHEPAQESWAQQQARIGYGRSKITSKRQALTRAFFTAAIIVGCWLLLPFPWWGRLLSMVGARFIYGMFASSDRWHRYL